MAAAERRTRTNHRLRLDMRQFADENEIDLAIVGCGAGGSVLLQRLARAGWRVAALDAGPFWDPDTDWVSDEAGSHHLYWTDPRVIAGDDPVRWGRTTPAGASAARWSTTRAIGDRRFQPERLRHAQPRWSRRRLADSAIRSFAPTTERSSRSCRSRGSAGRGVIRTVTRTGRIRAAGTAEVFLRGARKLGITAKVGPVATPTAGSGAGRTAFTGGSACRGAR